MQIQTLQTGKSSSIIARFLLWIFLFLGPAILTQDIPVHIYNARVLSELFFSGNLIFEKYFQLIPGIQSNVFTQWVSVIPSAWMSPVLLERLLIFAMILNLTQGFRNLLKKYKPESEQNWVFILPFIFPVLLLKGFSNFYFGIGFVLQALALIPELLKGQKVNKFIFYTLLIFLCHPFAVLTLGVSALPLIFIYTSTEADISPKTRWRAVLYLLPVLALVLLSGKPEPLALSTWDKIFLRDLLWNVHDWVWYSENEIIPLRIILCMYPVLIFLGIYHRSGLFQILMFLLTICMLVLYFYAPVGAKENLYIYPRIVFTGSIFLALSVASSSVPEFFMKIGRYIALGVCIFLIWSRYDTQVLISETENKIQEISSQIPAGSVVLPRIYPSSENCSDRAEIYLHTLARSKNAKKIICLDNYAANTGYFQVEWKKEINPYIILGDSWEKSEEIFKTEDLQKLRVTHILEVFPAQRDFPEGEYRAGNKTARLWKVYE